MTIGKVSGPEKRCKRSMEVICSFGAGLIDNVSFSGAN
jgi:hypothetical protein